MKKVSKRKLKNSTILPTHASKFQESSDLHPEDISRIIQSCKDAGVRELSFRGLNLRFDAPSVPLQSETNKSAMTLAEQRQLQTVVERQALRHDEAQLRQDQIDLMKIEDPVRYEELVLSGELKLDSEQDEDD